MSSHYSKATFLLSAADVAQLPADSGFEVAIVGRSNAGKSSVLNRMTQVKQLARVSKTPGRTQLVNIFVLDDQRRIADLPGYGFAKAPPSAQREWQKTVDTYIRTRACLKGLILVMDIRHPFKPLDLHMLEFAAHRELPVHILLNKADKLSKGAVAKLVISLRKTASEYGDYITMSAFSALKGTGVEELHAVMDAWLEW